MARFFIFLFTLLMPVANVLAADFFVRPSANPGTYGLEDGSSYDNAWNGFTNIVWGGAGVNPGDTLYVAGEHISQQLSIGVSGTDGNNVVITGNYAPDPGILNASNTVASSLQTNGNDYLEISHLQISSSTDNGIFISASSSYIWVHDNNLQRNTFGIRVLALNGHENSNIYIYNNTTAYGQTGIQINSSPATPGDNHSIEVYNNISEYNGWHGIVIAGNSYDITIGREGQGNTVRHNGSPQGLNQDWGTGIEIFGFNATTYPYNILVEYNEAHNTIDADGDGTDGVGIRFDDYTRTSIARYNYVHNNEGTGMVDGNKFAGYGNEISYNLIVDNTQQSAPLKMAGILIDPGDTQAGDAPKVYNNTIIGGDNSIYVRQAFDVDIRNNIGAGASESALLLDEAVYDGNLYTEEHNIFHDFGEFLVGRITTPSASPTNVSDSIATSSSTSSPQFVGGSDYSLQSTSPAINAGTDLSYSIDYIGNDIFGLPDIGAYEYQWISPTANFSSDTSQLSVSFTDSSSDSDGTVVVYSWDFGDSVVSSSENPSHTYGAGGDYTVQLVVTDNHGAQATTTQHISVSEPRSGSSGTRIRSRSGVATTNDSQSINETARKELIIQIAELQALIEMLQSQFDVAPSVSCIFNRNLQVNDVGEDVRCLQQYLNQNNFVLASDGFGAPGQETTFFGLRTYNALVRFQEANASSILAPIGVTTGTGYFGPSTRAFMAGN